MTKQATDQNQISVPPDVLLRAQARARELGMTLSEYTQSLIDEDIKTKEHDPWREPVPKGVQEQWARDIAETEEEEKRTGKPRKTYYDGEEFVKDMQAKT